MTNHHQGLRLARKQVGEITKKSGMGCCSAVHASPRPDRRIAGGEVRSACTGPSVPSSAWIARSYDMGASELGGGGWRDPSLPLDRFAYESALRHDRDLAAGYRFRCHDAQG